MPTRSAPTVTLAASDAARPDEYLTVGEVAARLCLRPKTVRNRMYDGTWRRGEHWFTRRGIGPRFKWPTLARWLEGSDETATSAGRAYLDIPRERPKRIHVDGKSRTAI